MRLILVAIVAAFCLFGAASGATAGAYVSAGTYTGTPSPIVSRLFAAFPNGGDGLIAALRELLINNPELADDVAYLGVRGGNGQEQAAAAALSQAVTILVNRGNNGGATRITTAARLSGSVTIQTAVSNSIAGTVSFSGFPSNNPDKGATAHCTTTTTTVSGAQPVTTCQ
jgi:hypothetical protein